MTDREREYKIHYQEAAANAYRNYERYMKLGDNHVAVIWQTLQALYYKEIH